MGNLRRRAIRVSLAFILATASSLGLVPAVGLAAPYTHVAPAQSITRTTPVACDASDAEQVCQVVTQLTIPRHIVYGVTPILASLAGVAHACGPDTISPAVEISDAGYNAYGVRVWYEHLKDTFGYDGCIAWLNTWSEDWSTAPGYWSCSGPTNTDLGWNGVDETDQDQHEFCSPGSSWWVTLQLWSDANGNLAGSANP